MTVRELREILTSVDDDLPIVVYNYERFRYYPICSADVAELRVSGSGFREDDRDGERRRVFQITG